MTASPSVIPDILSENQYRACRLCPRQCGADRRTPDEMSAARAGYCRCGSRIRVARAALHFWEEPCISGTAENTMDFFDGGPSGEASDFPANDPSPIAPAARRGSGAVFFSGCTLGCCFCQNYPVSHENFGREIPVDDLARIFLRLQDQGAYNINLVTATQYLPSVVRALELVRGRLKIPVVYNCGGYERPEIVKALADYVDIWIPDLKYFDQAASSRYSQAGDYFRYASAAIPQMIAQTGPPVLDSRGIMRSGVIVRHLVLPGMRKDSIRLLFWMKEHLPDGGYYLSLMSQYTPAGKAASHAGPSPCPELGRRITTYEYESVLNTALDLGLDMGYMQQKSSAKEEYTPPFNLEGV